MADEQVIGVAQLRLEAEIKDFEKGMEDARKSLEEGEASFVKYASRGEKEGARLLQAEQRVDREIASLTETAAQRQMRMLDERYAREVERARKFGVDQEKLAQLEVEVHRKKHAILVEEEKRGAAQRVEAIKPATAQTIEAKLKTEEFGAAMRLAGVGSEKFSAGLKLLNSTAGPVAITIGAIATVLFDYSKQMEIAEKANREFLRAASDTDRRLKDQAIDIEAAAGRIGNAEQAKLEAAIERQVIAVEEAARKVKPAVESWQAQLGAFFGAAGEEEGGVPVLTDLSLAIGARLSSSANEAERALAKEQLALEELIKRLALLKKAQEEAGARATKEDAQKKLDAYKEFEKKARAHDDKLQAQDDAAIAKYEAEMAAADARAAAAAEKQAAKIAAIEEEAQEERLEVVREYALERLEAENQAPIGGLLPEWLGGRKENADLRPSGPAPTVNDGRGFGNALYIWPGGVPMNPPSSKVTVNNYKAEQVGVTVKQGPGGTLIIDIADSILTGGDIARAIEETYGLQRGG